MRILCLLLSLAAIGHARIVTIHTPDEEFCFQANQGESLTHIMMRAEPFIEQSDVVLVEIAQQPMLDVQTQLVSIDSPRDYCREVTQDEKYDIQFIVNTLANRSLVAIGFSKVELERAGARVDHLHPLRFLSTVFTDEELKVGVRNMRGKGWVWNQFIGHLRDTLSEEKRLGNIPDQYVQHFAEQVGLPVELLLPCVDASNWEALIDVLITHIPRKGNHQRYDCYHN